MSDLVSVIIPTYKRNVDCLKRAIESVLHQTYDNVEIVVIDDSPMDYEGRDEVKKYIETIKAANIHFIQNTKNLGGSLARNVGISMARGEYITFLDDDDEYLPDKILKQLSFMKDKNLDVSFTKMIIYNMTGTVVDIRDYADLKSFDNDNLLKYHLTKQITGTPTFMYKTEKLKEIGGFDAALMGQEFLLMLKSIEKGLKIGYLPECFVRVYRHTESISFGPNKIIGQEKLFEIKKTYFEKLNNQEKRFVKFRHYAVMAIAYRRNNQYKKMLSASVFAFLCAPKECIVQFADFAKKIIKIRLNGN